MTTTQIINENFQTEQQPQPITTPTDHNTIQQVTPSNNYSMVATVLIALIIVGLSILLANRSNNGIVQLPKETVIKSHSCVSQLVHKSVHNLNNENDTNLQLQVQIPINNSLETGFHFNIQVNDPKYMKRFNFSTFEMKHHTSHNCFFNNLEIENVIYDPQHQLLINYSIPIQMDKKCFVHNLDLLPHTFNFTINVQDIRGIQHAFTFSQDIKANFVMGFFKKALKNLQQKVINVVSVGASGTSKSTGIVEFSFFRDISNSPDIIIDLPANTAARHDTIMLSGYDLSTVPEGKQNYQFSIPFNFTDTMGELNVTDFNPILLKGQLPYGKNLVVPCKKSKNCLEAFKRNHIHLPDIVLYYISPETISNQARDINDKLNLIHDLGISAILMFPAGQTQDKIDTVKITGKHVHKVFLYDYYRRDDPISANNPKLHIRTANLLLKMLEIVNGKNVHQVTTQNEPHKNSSSSKN